MSGLQAPPSWKYPNVRPTALALQAAAQQLARPWYRGRGIAAATRASLANRRGSMTGVCAVAMLLFAVPLFTLEADARGGGGGFGGHGGGFGGHGGGFGGHGGGFAARGGGFGGRSLLRRGAFRWDGRWCSLRRRHAFRRRGSWPPLLQRSALRRVAYRRSRARRSQFRRTFVCVAAHRDRAGRGRRPPLYHRPRPDARRSPQ